MSANASDVFEVDIVVPGLTEALFDTAADTLYDKAGDSDVFLGCTMTTGHVWMVIAPGDTVAAFAVLEAIRVLYAPSIENGKEAHP